MNEFLIKRSNDKVHKNPNGLLRSVLIVSYILAVLVIAGLARASSDQGPDQGQIEFGSELNPLTGWTFESRIEVEPAPLH